MENKIFKKMALRMRYFKGKKKVNVQKNVCLERNECTK